MTIRMMIILALILRIASSPQLYAQPVSLPGPIAGGRTLLPNGWSLSPAGKHLPLGELPLNMAISPDGRSVVVVNSGTGRQELTVINLPSWRVVQRVPLHRSWLGIGFIPSGKELLVSGGNDNSVLRFAVNKQRLTLVDSIPLGKPWPENHIWTSGLCIHPSGTMAYAVGQESSTIYLIDLKLKNVNTSAHLPGIPYTTLYSVKHNMLYVSIWDSKAVVLLDPQTLALKATIQVDDHPCDLIETQDGRRLFVACANSNSVDVIDLDNLVVGERLICSLIPGAPEGSTTNALALSPAGDRLAVANADNNCLAYFDISKPHEGRSLGFVPTGWYPTCVRFESRNGDLLVASAKGLTSAANPLGPEPGRHTGKVQYIASMFSGVLSRIPSPKVTTLARWSQAVYHNSPVVEPFAGVDTSLLRRLGSGKSPAIRHIFYLIKENRTYDQVFGDMAEGNGDSALCLFPEMVTPNQHALARAFVLLDNFYCDAEVSADGHNWSMAAYATDYTEKTWPTSYGERGGEYVYEGGTPIVYPSAGYLWDDCMRNGVSYRSYGEFARNGSGPNDSARGLTPALESHVAPWYHGWDLDYSDVERVKDWEREFVEYERKGDLPGLEIIRLPNDHTQGTATGALTPRAFVAQNDLAVGMLVERITRSPYWKESAIFVVEDDAQNGPDHVDAHRSTALVISPYVRRHAVDHHMYSTSGLIRTMELLLGLPPMSQFDASALPMSAAFANTADTLPFTHKPALVDLQEWNHAGMYGQSESDVLDFTREDAVPDATMNRILWKALRGERTPLPPPVRGAYVKGPVGD